MIYFQTDIERNVNNVNMIRTKAVCVALVRLPKPINEHILRDCSAERSRVQVEFTTHSPISRIKLDYERCCSGSAGCV